MSTASDDAGRAWTPERVLCRTVGCTSIFSRWWQWPHRLICTPLATRVTR